MPEWNIQDAIDFFTEGDNKAGPVTTREEVVDNTIWDKAFFDIFNAKEAGTQDDWDGMLVEWAKSQNASGVSNAAGRSLDPGDAAKVGQIGALQWIVTADGERPRPKDFPEVGREAMSITGLAIDRRDFLDGAFDPDPDARYAYLVSLLDGDLTVNGSKFGDGFLEVGEGGRAVVDGGGGDDSLYVWHKKTVVFDGGKGVDSLRFEYRRGFFDAPENGAVVDLIKGTGVNPYGGTLKVSSIENLAGTFNAANDLRGNGAANVIEGGIAADTLRGEGGDDFVSVKYHTTLDPRATLANGGKGVDTLSVQLSDGSAAPFTGSGFDIVYHNILDLEKPENNTGTFHGGTFRNFEIFRPTGTSFMQFDFRGSGADETAFGLSGDDILDGGGGDDVLIGQFGADVLVGGRGEDTASYEGFVGVTASLAKPSTNTGDAAGDAYASIENLSGSDGADRLTGDDGANVLAGRGGNDTLAGRAGADAFRFDVAPDGLNVDRIVDFEAGADTIHLNSKIFDVLRDGALKASAFKDLSDGKVDRDDRILYDRDDGSLFYDPDGKGGLDAVLFAILDDKAALTHADVLVI